MDLKLIQSEQLKYNADPKDPLITVNQMQTLPEQAKVIIRVHEQQEEPSVHTLVVDYRPDDAAVAIADVAKELFGVTLQAGSAFRPAETKRVKVSLTETREVPWGPNEIPALEGARMEVGATYHPEKGALGQVEIYAKNKFTPVVKEFFNRIEARLKTHSIYRGQAIVGTDSPEFYDLGKFRPELVTHSDLVANALDVFLFTRLRNRGLLSELGETFGVKILLHGPYGTGKTSTALQAACIAAEYGIGFIHHRPGKDDVFDTLRTAKLYSDDGIIVLLEDIDVIASNKISDRELQRLLEAFDGATSKGSNIIIVMTTNHRDRIHPGMFRPGRTDMEVEINELDRSGVEKLVRAHVGDLLGDVDFDRVYEETVVDGRDTFTGSHVESMVRHVRMAGLHRTGSPVFDLETEDFIKAAAPVKLQQKLQAQAKEGDKPPAIEQAISAVVKKAIETEIVESDRMRELLMMTTDQGVSYGRIESLTRDVVQEAIDATVLMDRDKESVKGALHVQ